MIELFESVVKEWREASDNAELSHQDLLKQQKDLEDLDELKDVLEQSNKTIKTLSHKYSKLKALYARKIQEADGYIQKLNSENCELSNIKV
jgi:hypothetical protein